MSRIKISFQCILSLTRSKAVEHARGCVATKIGLFDILVMCRLKDMIFARITAIRRLVQVRELDKGNRE